MIKISRDIEPNPGSKHKQDQSLSICHWNLSSIPAHNFQKLELLEGYISSTVILIIHHIWLHGLMIKFSGDIELNLGLNISRIKVFQFVTGT